jgi:hypothetical protein
VLQKLFKFTQGKHTAFAVAFFAAGNVFHYLGKLDQTYVLFMTSLLGLVLGHSIKDDYHGREMAKIGGDKPPDHTINVDTPPPDHTS